MPSERPPGAILVIGRSGQLGRCLGRRNPAEGLRLVCRGREDGCDIADARGLAAQLDALAPALVVNASAYTAVDRAEAEPDAAYAINRDGPAELARLCAERTLPLIHISTDYVFSGEKDGLYVEDDSTSPLNVYGASKAAGEAAIRARHARHVILRTSWVYSPFGGNFVKTMLRLAETRPELRIVDDQRGAPTSADDLAGAVIAVAGQILAGNGQFGTYHVSGSGETTWFGFAQEIFRQMEARGGAIPRLVPIRTEDYPAPALRPRNSRLDCGKVRDRFGIGLPPWQTSLTACLDELSRQGQAQA